MVNFTRHFGVSPLTRSFASNLSELNENGYSANEWIELKCKEIIQQFILFLRMELQSLGNFITYAAENRCIRYDFTKSYNA